MFLSLLQTIHSPHAHSTEAAQSHVHTLGEMISAILAEKGRLNLEIQEVFAVRARLRLIMSEHMYTRVARGHFITDKPMQEACKALTNYFQNPEEARPTPESIRNWLKCLENWLTLDTHKTANVKADASLSSEPANKILSVCPDSVGFITSRLRLLFGDIIPKKYVSLPSLNAYCAVMAIYLTTLERHPEMMDTHKTAICRQIQHTLNTYLEFTRELQGKTQLWQALLNLYDTHRNRIVTYTDNIMTHAPQKHTQEEVARQIVIISNQAGCRLAQHGLEETRLLLISLTLFVDTKTLDHYYPLILRLEGRENIFRVISQELKLGGPPLLQKKESRYPYADFIMDQIEHNYKSIFQWYKLISQGRLIEAELYLLKSKSSSLTYYMAEAYSLLFLTAISGRWYIFENFANQFSLPSDFNFGITATGGFLTPLMIAAHHGHLDVVAGLLKTNAVDSLQKRTFEGKTAAQLALEQKYFDIAHLIWQNYPAGLTDNELKLVKAHQVEAFSSPGEVSKKTDTEAGLKQLLERVTASQTALNQYVSTPEEADTYNLFFAKLQKSDSEVGSDKALDCHQ